MRMLASIQVFIAVVRLRAQATGWFVLVITVPVFLYIPTLCDTLGLVRGLPPCGCIGELRHPLMSHPVAIWAVLGRSSLSSL